MLDIRNLWLCFLSAHRLSRFATGGRCKIATGRRCVFGEGSSVVAVSAVLDSKMGFVEWLLLFGGSSSGWDRVGVASEVGWLGR